MRQSSFSKKINDYKKCMNILDCTNFIFLNEISNYNFNNISKYKKSKFIFEKIVDDFNLVNSLLDINDVLNATSILRTIYENLLYFIATSYDETLIVNFDSSPRDFRYKIEENCDILFSEYFDKDDFNKVYKYLCKLLHPSSMKELVSYLSRTKKYQKYICNNIKYIMLVIEFMLLDYLNKILLRDNSFNNDLINFCTYVNLVNIKYYFQDIDKTQKFTKKYLFYDTDNKYVNGAKNDLTELYKNLISNKDLIQVNINELAKKIDKQIAKSDLEGAVKEIMKKK